MTEVKLPRHFFFFSDYELLDRISKNESFNIGSIVRSIEKDKFIWQSSHFNYWKRE